METVRNTSNASEDSRFNDSSDFSIVVHHFAFKDSGESMSFAGASPTICNDICPPDARMVASNETGYTKLKLVKSVHMALMEPLVCGLSFEALPAWLWSLRLSDWSTVLITDTDKDNFASVSCVDLVLLEGQVCKCGEKPGGIRHSDSSGVVCERLAYVFWRRGRSPSPSFHQWCIGWKDVVVVVQLIRWVER